MERTIGLLKGRFRCLLGARELHFKPEKAGRIIYCCCALHNLCIQYKVPCNPNITLESEPENEESAESTNVSGTEIRNQILNGLC